MTKDVAVKQSAELTTPAPRGFEAGVDAEDLIIPRAKLLQALSPEVQEGELKQGLIINSLTKDILPEEFIPVFTFKDFIRFNPRNAEDNAFNPDFEPGQIIWRSKDPQDPRVLEETRFGADGSKPLATTFMNFFALFPGVSMPVIVSFSKTSYKTGKQLLSLAKFCGGDMFSRKYSLKAVKEQNDIGTYFVLKVASLGAASEAEQKAGAQMWADYSPKTGKIEVHDVAEDERPY